MGGIRGAVGALGVLFALATPAVWADEPAAPAIPASEPERPWARGVSVDDQTRAQELFARGNELHDQGLFKPALDLYRQAIRHWDHPAIRYNIAVALINLERLLEAHENLAVALRFGGAGLEPGVQKQAREYQRLLDGQVVRLVVDCVDPGARVSLDGRDLMACPGSRTELVLAGGHRLVAEKPGHLTRTLDLALAGGQQRKIHLDLLSIQESTVTRRRWARWKPWAVVGAGVAVGLVGLGFQLQSRATLRSYDDAVAVLCPDTPCETLPPVVTGAYDDAMLQNRVAIGLFVTGGVATAAGLTLVWLNRGVTERIGYGDSPAITPVVGPGVAGLSFGGRF